MKLHAMPPFSSPGQGTAAGPSARRAGTVRGAALELAAGAGFPGSWWLPLLGCVLVVASLGLSGCGGEKKSADAAGAQPKAPTTARPTPIVIRRPAVWTPPPIGVMGEEEATPVPVDLLSPSLLSKYVGEQVEITLNNGDVLRVNVLSVAGSTVKVMENVGGGEIRYDVQKSTIKGFQASS